MGAGSRGRGAVEGAGSRERGAGRSGSRDDAGYPGSSAWCSGAEARRTPATSRICPLIATGAGVVSLLLRR